MSRRSFSYWFVCTISAVIAAGAAEPHTATPLDLHLPEAAISTVLPWAV